MAAHGIIDPMPDYAVFADTGWKPIVVYDQIASLTLPNVLPFPVYIVSAGNTRENLIGADRGQRRASIPAFTHVVNRPRTSAVLAGVFLPSIVVT
jgi:hypothetical protein